MQRIQRQLSEKLRGYMMRGEPKAQFTQSGPSFESVEDRRASRKRERVARKTSGSNKGQKTSTGRKSWDNR